MTRAELDVKSGWAFHVHHDRLWEWCTNYEERLDYIRQQKPRSEQSLRLRLFKLIPPDRIPDAFHQAWVAYNQGCDAYDKRRDAYDQATVAYDQARFIYNQAWVTYHQAWIAYAPDMEALHAELCPNCPWDGFTIFGEAKNDAR